MEYEWIKFNPHIKATYPIEGLRLLVEIDYLNHVTKTGFRFYGVFRGMHFYALLYKKKVPMERVVAWAYAPENKEKNG